MDNSSIPSKRGAVTQGNIIDPGYFDLKALASYSCCSIRWIRDRLVDRTQPLPHYRIEGKILVKRDDFDRWIRQFLIDQPADEMDDVVSGVLAQLTR